MRSHRALLFSLTALALILSCSASGAREGSAAPEKAQAAPAAAPAAAAGQPFHREGLSNVDFTGMDAAAKERALKHLNTLTCDCGCTEGTVANCRVNDPSCTRSTAIAKQITDAIKAGKTDEQVIAAVKGSARDAQAPASTPQPAAGPVQISMENAQVKGNPKAAATLVEYADFQCPWCARAYPVTQQLLTKYGDDLKFVFKQYPLPGHQFAEPAARASLAAARQGKFWEMYDVLFQNARALDDASLRKYAQGLGLDMARFDKDRADASINEQMNQDVAEAQRVGVQGTPSFFINGVQAPSWDVETMSRMIDAAKSGASVAAVAAEVRKVYEEQERKRREAMQQAANRVHDIDIKGSPVKGDPKAPVTIVEFSDFQCPACAGAEPILKQVLEAYNGKVKLVYKHLPLNIHPNARPAALAALEANQHGKFWEMHELLFQNYAQLSRDRILSIAKQVGVPQADVEKALDTPEHAATLDKDVADYMKTSPQMSTPSLFVNGKRMMQRDFATFKRMIEEALAASGTGSAS